MLRNILAILVVLKSENIYFTESGSSTRNSIIPLKIHQKKCNLIQRLIKKDRFFCFFLFPLSLLCSFNFYHCSAKFMFIMWLSAGDDLFINSLTLTKAALWWSLETEHSSRFISTRKMNWPRSVLLLFLLAAATAQGVCIRVCDSYCFVQNS